MEHAVIYKTAGTKPEVHNLMRKWARNEFYNQNPHKKVLEELNLRKQLLKIGTAQTLNPSALNTPIGVPLINSNPASSENQMSTTARAALQHANNTSFGYFVPQESSFGNNILAVLPRFNENK